MNRSKSKANKKSRRPAGPNERMTLRKRVARMTLGDIGTLIGDAWEGVGAIAGLNEEIKKLDTTSTGTITNAGVVSSLSLIAEGNDYNQRDGHSIKAISLEARLTMQSYNATTNNMFRWIVFRDLEQNGVQPTAAQLLESVGGAYAPNSAYQHDNTERFEILHDVLHEVSYDRPVALLFGTKLGCHIRFSGTTAADASNKEGHIYAALFSADGANGPAHNAYYRLCYVDN